MEQKDVDGIANAVSRELVKLNKSETEVVSDAVTPVDETFICPECGSVIEPMMPFCPGCGCELEWGE